MNNLINIDPLNLLEEIFGFDRRNRSRLQARVSGRFPPLNVFQDDDAVLIELELPGKTAADVELKLEAQAVVVSDRPAAPAEGEGAVVPPPAWSRRIELPFRANADKANAKFVDGILRITLPRAENDGVRRIAIA